MSKIYFIGVDVGTASVRAALVNSSGKVINQHVKEIQIWNSEPDHYEQSSDDIWKSVCICVNNVITGIPSEQIVGIGFDATCSLVVLGENGLPLSVSLTGDYSRNIIMWMDHRATKETEKINFTKHELLKFVGGKVSLEMELPKLLWLKNNLNISCYSKIWRVFDLPDFLTWKSTGHDSRSLCSVVCKWNYDAIKNEWPEDFLVKIGLSEMCENDFMKIGNKIQEPGKSVGNGLSKSAAEQLNLLPGTSVGTSIIDAHAGALAMFGCSASNHSEIEEKLVLICGTSTCHMSLSKQACLANGIWGPYKNAIIPGFHLNEGGQSAAGKLLDFIVKTHPKFEEISKNKLKCDENIYSYLNDILKNLAKEKNLDNICYLTKNFHVWPDYHGNRSPIADSELRGMISGLSMAADEEDLALNYLAFIQALSYGTKHIIECLHKNGRSKFSTLLFCGGLSKNAIYIETHADACNIPAIVPDEQEMVLVGSAMLGAYAAKVFPTLKDAADSMSSTGKVIKPNPQTVKFHNKKYQVFLKMLENQKLYRKIMEEIESIII